MKYLLSVVILIFLIIISGFMITGCSKSPAVLGTETSSSDYQKTERQRSTLFVALEKPSNDYPIAAGIYYPWNEEKAEVSEAEAEAISEATPEPEAVSEVEEKVGDEEAKVAALGIAGVGVGVEPEAKPEEEPAEPEPVAAIPCPR